jgi:hypothetical protein
MPRRTIPQRPGNSRRGIFSKMVFVLSGDFEKSHQKMEAWIGGQGGRVDKVVTSETTHLICTMDDFKNKVTHGKCIICLLIRPQ